MLWRFLSFISPPLLAVALVGLAVLGIHNAVLRDGKSRAEAQVILLQAQYDVLDAARVSQNTAIDQQAAEGEARRSATESRLEAFPTVGLPVSFDAPLTGATACERAEDARSRLIESLQ